MSADSSETVDTAQRQTREVTDLEETLRMLGELAERKDLLFFKEIGVNLSFIANATGVDARRRTFRIAVAAAQESRTDIRVGSELEVFVPIRSADLVFATSVAGAVSGRRNSYDLAIPSRIRLWPRREHPRGSCFGLVDVILRRSDKAQSKALKATLNDISNAGVGISLPQGTDQIELAGAAFDDCVLLLNNKPMASCTIEILHIRHESEAGGLIAGGRFINLDDLAKERIAKLIEALDPLWAEGSTAP